MPLGRLGWTISCPTCSPKLMKAVGRGEGGVLWRCDCGEGGHVFTIGGVEDEEKEFVRNKAEADLAEFTSEP